MEGVADRRSAGHIAVDNIQIMDGLRAEDCKGEYRIVIAHLLPQILLTSPEFNLTEAVCFLLQIQKLLRLLQPRSSSYVSTNPTQ